MIEIINYCNQQANKNFSCDYMYAVLPPCILGLGSNDAIKKNSILQLIRHTFINYNYVNKW